MKQRSLIVVQALLLLLGSGILTADAISVSVHPRLLHRRLRSFDLAQYDPSLTKFTDYCPNGYIAYSKFNTSTGVFDCAIKTAEICYVLCDLVHSSNWDITNPVSSMDPREFTGYYCRALPGYATRPCYFKPMYDILQDVREMYRWG